MGMLIANFKVAIFLPTQASYSRCQGRTQPKSWLEPLGQYKLLHICGIGLSAWKMTASKSVMGVLQSFKLGSPPFAFAYIPNLDPHPSRKTAVQAQATALAQALAPAQASGTHHCPNWQTLPLTGAQLGIGRSLRIDPVVCALTVPLCTRRSWARSSYSRVPSLAVKHGTWSLSEAVVST